MEMKAGTFSFSFKNFFRESRLFNGVMSRKK